MRILRLGQIAGDAGADQLWPPHPERNRRSPTGHALQQAQRQIIGTGRQDKEVSRAYAMAFSRSLLTYPRLRAGIPTASAIASRLAKQQQHGFSLERCGQTLQRFDEEIAAFPKSFKMKTHSFSWRKTIKLS